MAEDGGERYAGAGSVPESGHPYRRLLDAVDDGIYRLDPEGRFVAVNDVFTTLTGYDREELLGQHVSLVLDDTDVARVEAMVHSMLANDLSGRPVDIPLETRDGDVIPCEVQVSVIEDGGEFAGSVGVVRDTRSRDGIDSPVSPVTGRYESLVDDVLDEASVGVTVVDADGAVAWINEATERYFGVDRAAVIGREEGAVLQAFRDAVADPEDFLAAHGSESSDQRRREFQVVPDEDRDHRWVDHQRSAIETGRYEGGHVNLYYDVTGRKQSQQVARERQERLNEEQAFTESLLDAQQDIVYALDAEGRPLRWNDRAREVTGYSDAEIAWMNVTDFIADDGHEAAIEALSRVCEEGEPTTVELPLLTASGEEIPYQFSGTPLRDDDGTVVGVTGIGRDVSRLREQARRLERQRDELEAELSEVFDRIDDAFVALDERFRFTYVNERAEALLEASAGDLVGAAFADADAVTADLLAGAEHAFDAQTQVTVEDYVPAIDAWLESHVYPSETGVSVYVRDVTERERRERALESHRERLAALDDLNGVVRNVTDAVFEQSTRTEIERVVVDGLVTADSYEAAWIGAADPGSESVRVGAAAGFDESVSGTWIPVESDDDAGDRPASRAARAQEIHVRTRDETDEPLAPVTDDGEPRRRSVAAIPVVHQETLYGVLSVETDREAAFSEEERAVVGQLGELVGHAIASVERMRALTSDEVVEVEFGVENVFADVAGVDGPDGIRYEQSVPIGDDRYHVYGTATSEGIATLETIAEQSGTITDVRTISADGDRCAFELHQTEPPLASALATHGATLSSAVVDEGTFRLSVRFPPGVDVRTIKDVVTDVYPDAALLAQRQVTRPAESATRVIAAMESELTERQRVVLQAAYFGGYFEWPRGSTGEELAESLDIAPATFSQHLRTAQRRLFGVLLDDESPE